MLIDPRRVVVAAALVGVFALASCGGSGDSSSSTDTTNPAEAHNSAILGEAESDAESVTAIEEELEYQLAPYEYSGVEGTFVTTDGDYCTLGEIYAGEELKPYKNDKNTLLSPNGSVGVTVGTFQGTQDAPCLKAVGEALGWVGGEKKPVTKGAPLSESKLIEEADAICKEGNDEVDTIFGPVETAEEEARALSEARPGVCRSSRSLRSAQATSVYVCSLRGIRRTPRRTNRTRRRRASRRCVRGRKGIGRGNCWGKGGSQGFRTGRTRNDKELQ